MLVRSLVNVPRQATRGATASLPRRATRVDPARRAARKAALEEPLAWLAFSRESLPGLRRLVATAAARARIDGARAEDLVLAIGELATNSVMHGGGSGKLRLWVSADGVRCEVRDRGHIADPLVGLRPPRAEQGSGRGLWMAGRLCDHLEISSSPGGTVVRVHMRR